MQPLRVSLVPVEAPAQKQSLGRPRDLFGRHHIEALAPQVRAVPDDSQSGVASPARVTGQNAGEPPCQPRR